MWGKIMIPIFCHLIGDYVLQSNYIAVGKAASWWLLLVHCTLYILPFYMAFGLDIRLMFLFLSHFAVDMFDRWVESNDLLDQLTHLGITYVLYVM